MFRIQNAGELSNADLRRQEASDKVFAWKLARNLAARANAGTRYPIQKLPRIAQFVVEPVSTRQRLFKARRAGTRKACHVRVVNPDNVLRF